MSELSIRGKQFLLDGKPFTVISGAIHYFRVIPEYWEDRLKKLRACGFNTVETYVAWNLHERREGEFCFSGGLDIVRFIEIADSLGLKVILRPGPFICAEFEGGGLPSWLLRYPDVRVRCNSPRYLEKVRPYYRELLTRVAPYLSTHGGPIIMMQVENEYGSFADDKDYLRAVTAIYREYGADCLLFTSDGPCDFMISGGTIPELFSVMNFGDHPRDAFAAISAHRPHDPLMCGEFWCGMFDHWGEEHHLRAAEDTVRDLHEMLEMGASFNFYMFHGGTNFGFLNGANYDLKEGLYQPTVTSYDYSAPLSEAGDLTPTYFAVRGELSRFLGKEPPLDVKNTEKAAYGSLTLSESVGLFDALPALGTGVRDAAPLSMEEVGQDFGYLLYSTTLRGNFAPRPLVLEDLHDRAHIFVNGKLVGIRDRMGRCDEVMIGVRTGEEVRLDILVENLGRINFGHLTLDRKGLLGGVRLGMSYHFDFTMTPLTMEDLTALDFGRDTAFDGAPRFYRGRLCIDGTPADTFLEATGFHKGFITVNGFNLGRYWNDKGPQRTLYLPAPILREGENEIIVFETDGVDAPKINFHSEPILG